MDRPVNKQQVHKSAWSTIYDIDFLNWTATQAARLRRLKPASIDWLNIAEELDDLGRSERRARKSPRAADSAFAQVEVPARQKNE